MKNYSELPDGIESYELEKYFDEFLYEAANLNETEMCFAFEQLYELAFRQQYTFELLSEEMSNRVSAYIMNNLNYESFEIMDCIMHIIPCLGLKAVFDKIISDKHIIVNPIILNLIESCESEYGNNVADPFSGFR